ncbi:MAG: redoxin domain-containing protein [Planctomycetota bacterium]
MLARRLLGLLVALPAYATAQEPPADPFGHSRHGAEFDEGPRRAAHQMPGMSAQVRFPVAGLSPRAQAFFDQGVCQQHGFWYFEAERSFRQVAMLQPECAMAYWGMAMANVENTQRAAGFAAQAVQRAAGLPEREKLYVDAIAGLYQIDEALRTELQSGDAAKVKKAKDTIAGKKERDEKKLQRGFVRGLEAVVAACPDDLEAKAFLAIQSWRNVDHDIPISSHGAVNALLDQVFAVAPLHPAHHYRIHLWDREKAERALASAAVNGDTAPGIAHQWHMSGHIFAKLDRHREAAWQQDASGRVDHAHMLRERVMPFLIHNYGHNQEWLARSFAYVGRSHDALQVARNLAELPRHPKWSKLETGDDIAGYARSRLVSVCEDFELWPEAAALARDGVLDATASVKGEVQRLGLLGRASFRLGKLDDGERVLVDVAALLSKARAERAAAIDQAEDTAFAAKKDRGKTVEALAEAGRAPTDSVRSVLDLQRELRAEQMLAKGDAKAALAEFEAVGDLPKTLLADAHLAAGQADKAIEILEAEVKEHRNRAPAALRLLIALAAANKPEQEARRAAVRELLLGSHFAFDRSPLVVRSGLFGGDDARLAGDDGTVWPDGVAFPADFGKRPPLASLGPRAWSPVANPGFELPCVAAAAGPPRKLQLTAAGLRIEHLPHSNAGIGVTPGRAHLVVFYLGFACLHCVKQLEALAPLHAEFVAAGIDVIAIGNEALAATEDKVAALGAKKPPFPLLADAELVAFRAWHCHDDFERMPLHGTFLVDAQGRVRWQDISAEPFTDLAWLLGESKRLLALRVGADGKTGESAR